MFEEEAEEYADNTRIKDKNTYVSFPDESISGVQDFEGNYIDISERLIKTFKDASEFGYNKANEWHYPSKGELPKCDEETQLMFYVNCYYEIGGETITRKRTVLGYYKKSFLRDDVKLFVEKSRGYEDEHLPQAVIAWKEIELPKESE